MAERPGGPLYIPGLYKQRNKTFVYGIYDHFTANTPSPSAAAEQRRIFGRRFGGHHVERGAAEMSGIERGDERLLVQPSGPRAVLMR